MDKNFTYNDTRINLSGKTVEGNGTVEPLYNRRVQDGITSKSHARKMNLNRRHPNSERRGDGEPNYTGPSRRYTIDRRLTTRDRRMAA